MALLDDINRLLRDHTGYTGDGQGGNGALPVGDRSTARYVPNSRDWRDLLKTIAQTMGDPSALQDILDELDDKADLANSGKAFTSRAAAVSAGQANLPGTLGLIFTVEGSNNETLAVRSFSNASDDPLFASQPRWGVAMRVPNVAALATATAAERAATIGNFGAAGLVRLHNVGGTADAITADVPADAAGLGVGATGSYFLFKPLATNPSAGPTLQITGQSVARQLRDQSGAALAPGALVPNAWHLGYILSNAAIAVNGVMLTPAKILSLDSAVDAANAGVISMQSRIGAIEVGAVDVEMLSDALIQKTTRREGQMADMSALPMDTATGSRTMVIVSGANSRHPEGGIVSQFRIYLSEAVRFSVSSWKEDVPGAGTTFTPYDVKYFEGVAGWNEVDPQVAVPKGGLVGFGTTTSARTGTNGSLAKIGVRATSTTENVQFTASSTIDVKFLMSYSVTFSTGVALPGAVATPRDLIDKRFSDADGWTLSGCAIASGALESDLNATWAARAFPTNYPYSQLSKLSLSAAARIVGAGQVFGIGFITMPDGYELFSPAAVVDGVDGQLKIYRHSSQSAIAPTELITQVAIPWGLAGSAVSLTVKRERLRTETKLTNMLSGQSVSAVLDYADGTGGNCRPWGIPCILMPSTTAGGVQISRLKMVQGSPYPAGSAAKLVIFGDSNADGSAIAPDQDKAWTYLADDERISKGGLDTVIAARAGQTSSGVNASVAETLRLCDENTVALIAIGTNDAVIGSRTHAAWRASVSEAIAKIRAKTRRIAMCTLPPCGGAGAQDKRTAMNADIVGGFFGADLLPPVRFDLAMSANNDGMNWNATYRLDSNHMNVAGHAAMLERLRIDCPEAFE
ncbi:SGNH/GDSL hydrolase family protein [Paracoccus sp. (in: a-proteobacteria)]|uniref:SGNH/GDSL hydrolase family protein n=1 Tax=Paracoccus sp. TaxID=267 RepID=UPI0028A99379|nr:SGNH/GDSL hydrolase family protein [Paracoccus sp. (in: a-proteobacteria)]